MVRKYIFSIFCLFILQTAKAQLVEVLSGLTNPSGMTIHGNYLYISDRNEDHIIKIDLTQETPTPIAVINGLTDPTGLAIHGTDLYIAETNSNKISKIDISLENPEITTFTTDVNRPSDLEFKNNMLYISEIDGGKISNVDVTQSPIVVNEVVSVFAPYRIAFHNDDLYALTSDLLIKVNETNNTYDTITDASTVSFTSSGMAFKNDILYTTLAVGSPEYDNIIQIDISETPVISKDLISGTGAFANDLLINGNELYVCNSILGSIFKTDITNLPPTPTDVKLFNSPQSIVAFQDHFYVSEFGQERILKLSFVDGIPETSDAITNIRPLQLAIKDNALFFTAEFFGVLKVDLTETNLPITPTPLVNLSQPYGIAILENDLYFSDFSNGIIRKLDLLTNTTSQIISGLNGPSAIAIKDNELFIAEYFGDKISKINLTESSPNAIDVVTDVNRPFALSFFGDELYFADTIASKILKINSTSTTPETTEVASEASEVQGLYVNDDILYILEETKLSKLALDSALSVEEFNSMHSVNIYPNPSSNTITVKNAAQSITFSIYDLLGKKVNSGISSGTIDIKDLKTGMYILKLKGFNPTKFIKN